MLHIGLQIKDKEELEKIEKLLVENGLLSFNDFDKNKSGLYFMSVNPIDIKTLDDFPNDELIDECIHRGIEIY